MMSQRPEGPRGRFRAQMGTDTVGRRDELMVVRDEQEKERRRSASSIMCTLISICWHILQFSNMVVTVLLILVVVYLMDQLRGMQTELDQQHAQVESLRTQVQTKQQGQIQELNEAVEQEHTLTITTLAGTFTMVTCLITMFHMSSHIQNYNEPRVQRKIMAILWMSPIYSVTSLLSLVIPPIEVYLAIAKDFYESYCIYTFLAFLIAVLGRQTTPASSDDLPDGDDDVTLTTIHTQTISISPADEREAVVQVLAKHADHLKRPARCLRHWYHPAPETSAFAKANAVLTECQIMAMQFVFIRPLTSIANCVQRVMYNMEENSDATTYQNFATAAPTFPPTVDMAAGGNSAPTATDHVNGDGGTTRWLADVLNDTMASNMDGGQGDGTEFGAPADDLAGNSTGPLSILDNPDELQQATINYFTSPGFIIAMITNVSVFFAFTGLLKFYHAVRDDLAWCQPFPKFLTIKGVVFLTFWQGLAIRIGLSIENARSASQGAAQLSPAETNEKAIQIQNVLICLEMLFFSITHWCVFPAEEWKPEHQRKIQRQQQRRQSMDANDDSIDPDAEQRLKPGIGFQDFVQDIHQLYQGRRRVRRRGKASYTIQPRIDTMGGNENASYRDDNHDDDEENDATDWNAPPTTGTGSPRGVRRAYSDNDVDGHVEMNELPRSRYTDDPPDGGQQSLPTID